MKLSHANQAIVLAAFGLSLFGGDAVAQTNPQGQPLQLIQWDSRRLDQLDRNVRRLERALTQRNAQGQPVIIEPDPEVVTLQGRVDIIDRRLRDLEATTQRVNGDVERLTFALDEAESENATLRTRLTRIEARLQAFDDAAAAQARAAEAAAQEDASPTGDAVSDLAAARALSADPARGAEAFADVIANWPDTPQAREASWRLGDLRRSARDQAGAVQAYATALAGWPTDAWAGEVTLKLARGLAATNRKPQACAALGEFDRRYAARATPALKAVAVQVRGEADCAA